MTTTPPLALIEVLDRDGHVRSTHPVTAWPATIGRAIDNDIVIADPHVAAHHARLAAGAEGGVEVEAGETVNGLVLGIKRVAAGARAPVAADGAPPLLSVGRTRLRVRLPGHTLEPELPLAVPVGRFGSRRVLAAGIGLLVAGLLFRTWLDSDADGFGRTAFATLLAFLATAGLWCGAWALLSRIFTRQAQFGWHLRVFTLAGIAYLVIEPLAGALAFMFDLPLLADFAFVPSLAVGGAALAAHLLAVEPARPRLMRGVGAFAAIGGIALTLWLNHQRSDRFGNDLYLTHLMPPALLLARAQPAERFVEGIAALKPALDRKAAEPEDGSDNGDDGE